jgi:hypothetical protein
LAAPEHLLTRFAGLRWAVTGDRLGTELIFRAGLLVAALLAVCFRNPIYLTAPRFWAEEGSYYFASAYNRGFFERLTDLSVVPYAPYFIPFPHFATLMAAYLVPLEFAPLFTTLMSLLLMLAVAAVIAFSEIPLLRSRSRRVLALCIFLLAPSSGEIWLNTLGASYYCIAAAVLLLLGAETATGQARRVNRILFALFCFLSPLSFILLPAVLWSALRAWRPHRVHLFSLAAVVVFQLIAHLSSSHAIDPARSAPVAFGTVGHLVASNHAVMPLLGWNASQAYAELVFGLSPSAFLLTGSLVGLAAALGLLGLTSGSPEDRIPVVLSLVAVCAVAAVCLLGLGDKRSFISPLGGERYTWLPNYLLLLLLMHRIEPAKLLALRFRQLALVLLLGLSLFHATAHFSHFTMASEDWPVWTQEVARWRADPEARPLASWPPDVSGEWVVQLHRN